MPSLLYYTMEGCTNWFASLLNCRIMSILFVYLGILQEKLTQGEKQLGHRFWISVIFYRIECSYWIKLLHHKHVIWLVYSFKKNLSIKQIVYDPFYYSNLSGCTNFYMIIKSNPVLCMHIVHSHMVAIWGGVWFGDFGHLI